MEKLQRRRAEISAAIAVLAAQTIDENRLRAQLKDAATTPEQAATIKELLKAAPGENLSLAKLHAKALDDLKKVDAAILAEKQTQTPEPLPIAAKLEPKTLEPSKRECEKPAVAIHVRRPWVQVVRNRKPINSTWKDFLSFTGAETAEKADKPNETKPDEKKQLELIFQTNNPQVQVRVPVQKLAIAGGALVAVVGLIIWLSGRKGAN